MKNQFNNQKKRDGKGSMKKDSIKFNENNVSPLLGNNSASPGLLGLGNFNSLINAQNPGGIILGNNKRK